YRAVYLVLNDSSIKAVNSSSSANISPTSLRHLHHAILHQDLCRRCALRCRRVCYAG
ncbi:hypothetical protein K523DRAFT_419087, partial [Schizophyllum commune Tattone D]